MDGYLQGLTVACLFVLLQMLTGGHDATGTVTPHNSMLTEILD